MTDTALVIFNESSYETFIVCSTWQVPFSAMDAIEAEMHLEALLENVDSFHFRMNTNLAACQHIRLYKQRRGESEYWYVSYPKAKKRYVGNSSHVKIFTLRGVFWLMYNEANGK